MQQKRTRFFNSHSCVMSGLNNKLKSLIMINLQALAALTTSKLIGNPLHAISNVADLEQATSQDASFFSNPCYQRSFDQSQAGVIFIAPQTPIKENKNYLICEKPSQAFQQLIDHFHPPRLSPSAFQGIHPTAVIHKTADLAASVTVGPHVVIDEHVVIQMNTFVGAGTYIGPYTTIGQNCVIHPRVVLREFCQLGDRVIIQPGAVIGSCGFGYQTNEQGQHIKLNQVGNVILENDVEIGANTTIDRARFKSTRIGQGSKIDNLVQIAHGVTLGTHNIIASQAGMAGSSSTGSYVVLAGQVGVVGHVYLEDKVSVSAQSGVSKSLKTGDYRGTPAKPIQEFNRHYIYLNQVEKQVNTLENRLKIIEDLLNKVNSL